MSFKKRFGTTLSVPHLLHLGVPISFAKSEIKKCKFPYLRIGAYWNVLEPNPNEFQFDSLHAILKFCERISQPVVLTVGIKSPRWPEFYWPSHITNKSLDDSLTNRAAFKCIQTVIEATKKYSCITHWQVENEPLDPSGPDKASLSLEHLIQEIELVRSLDNRPVLVTLWGNALKQRGFLPLIEPCADIIGIDLYYKVFFTKIFGKSFYLKPLQKHEELSNIISACKKPVWIAELQAEPWEQNEQEYLSSSPNSMSLELLSANIKQVSNLPVQEILLWGFEYWLWRAQHGDNSYLNKIAELNTH